MRSLRPSIAAPATLLCVGSIIVACGDDGDPTSDPTPDSGPRFAVALRLLTGSGQQSVAVGFADDLESGEVDVSNSVDIGSTGNVWGPNGSGDFYITRGEDLTVSKYRWEQGGPVLVRRLGLSGTVVGFVGEAMVFDGPDRGFLLQTSTGEGVELDLSTMEIVGPLDVSALLDPALPTFVNRNEYVRGDELVGVTYGVDLAEGEVSEVSKIFFFDPATSTFDVRPAPCGGLAWMMEASNGDLYFASNTLVASVHAINANAQAPCLVRLPAGSREPDPNPLSLNDFTTGPTAGLVPFGEFDSILVRVFDSERNPITGQETALEVAFSQGWDTWRMSLDDPTDAAKLDREPVVGQIGYFLLDGVSYENASQADQSTTILTRTTGADAPTPGLSTIGVPIAVVRLR